MKTSLLSRLSAVCLTLVLSSGIVKAQTTLYTEAPIVAKTGYWTLQTDAKDPSYTLVRFYNDNHEELYQERLNGVCLDPTKSVACHRRISRMLGTTLAQVQQMQSNSMVSKGFVNLNRQVQRTYAQR